MYMVIFVEFRLHAEQAGADDASKRLSLPQDPAGAGKNPLPGLDAKRQNDPAMSPDQTPAIRLRDAGSSTTQG